MIVKFFIFLMQSDGVLLQQKSTANTDGCIYSAYSEIIFLILYVFVFFYFFFILRWYAVQCDHGLSVYFSDHGRGAVHIRPPGFRGHWQWRG